MIRGKKGQRAATAPRSDGDRRYRVGEVAEAAGVSAQTIRLWEKQGLVSPERSDGGQRVFSLDQLKRAQKVALLRRRHGWNPASIRSALGAEPEDAQREAWREMTMGSRIRAARTSRGMTLAELAEGAGISRSFLSALERGENPISPGVLSGIADRLELPMSAFTPNVGPVERVVRAADRAQTPMAEGVYWEELATPGHALEPALLVVAPGGSSGGSYARPGEVFLTLLAGQLAFEIGADGFEIVRRGDSILLEPFVSWAWRNPGRTEARAVYVEELGPEAWR